MHKTAAYCSESSISNGIRKKTVTLGAAFFVWSTSQGKMRTRVWRELDFTWNFKKTYSARALLEDKVGKFHCFFIDYSFHFFPFRFYFQFYFILGNFVSCRFSHAFHSFVRSFTHPFVAFR